MITEYQQLPCDHPIIKEILFWHDEAWLDSRQLAALLHINRSKLKRLLRHIGIDQGVESDHSEVFSVVKKRSGDEAEAKREWVYQVRYYDTSVVRSLAEYCGAEKAKSFLRWFAECNNE